ncbi:MAG: RNA repair transcriptional activator RtcR [Planctomycetaceae bacterium]|nr:RNA repair transcriptional activator RtcR [Planctomycetaceae bacterium]
MTNSKDNVIIGFLGSKLDAGKGNERWERWRPTVGIGMHEELLIRRYELFYQENEEELLAMVMSDMADVSPETDIRTHLMPFDDPWDFEEVYGRLHDFARDYAFDTEREDYIVNLTTGTHTAQICLFLLTETRHFPARLLQASPPKSKRREHIPGTYRMIDLDLSKYDRLAARFAEEKRESTSFLKSGIETKNREFNRLINRIEQVVMASQSPILLTGATGVGKSQLARKIYELKHSRKQIEGRFVEINCATLRGDQSMSALFGHVKGAFTGAEKDRTGLLRSADGGLLFLDEIGELGLDEQAMLLRAIEEKRFLPFGSDTEVQSDFQLIAGTNRDLTAEVRQGRFREDLLARINLWTFRLPGLAERREDIAPNIDYELAQHTEKTGTKATFNKEARKKFLDFATSPGAVWSANFRDLNAAMTRMVTLAQHGRISSEVVDEEIERLKASWHAQSNRPTPTPENDLIVAVLGPEQAEQLDLFDRVTLAEVLRVCRDSHSLSEAGRRLFHVSRTKKSTPNDADRLRKYLAKFGLDWETVVEPDGNKVDTLYT